MIDAIDSLSFESLSRVHDHFIVRGHNEGETYGSSIKFTALLTFDRTTKVVTLRSAKGEITISQAKKIKEWCIGQLGAISGRWERIDNGKKRYVEIHKWS